MKILTLLCILLTQLVFADENLIATVLIAKGQIEVYKDGKLTHKNLQSGDELFPHEIIKTGNKSILKIQFHDKTTITLTPNTELRLEKIKENSPSLIQLLSGKLRAQVQKKKENGHSLFIKTPTASLGVRGTDFELIFNNQNRITSALTFKGELALINSKEAVHFDSTNGLQDFDEAYEEVLNDELSNEKTKLIHAGEFSGAFPGYTEPIIPVRIAKTQFEALKNSDTLKVALDEKTEKIDEINLRASAENKAPTNDILVPRPREYYTEQNYPSNVVALPGGYLDQKTGIYVSPPQDARYDEKDRVYVIPEEFGNIDQETGDYIPPLGLILHPLKGFIFLEDQFYKLSAKTQALAQRLNGTIKMGMAKLKELTRLDASLLPAFYYDSNIVSEFYGRVDEVSKNPSYVLRFDGFLAHKTLDTKNWLIYPKGSVTTLYNYNQEEREVNRQDSVDWTGGLELNHRYLISHRPGRQIFEVNYHITMKDMKGSDQYNYFTEDIYGIFGQEFKLHARHTTKIYGKFTYYETYLHKMGTIWSGHLKHSIDMGRRNDLLLGSSISRERPHNLRTVFIWDGFISHIRKNLWEHYTFTTTLRLRYTDLHLIIAERGEEKLISPEVRLTRILDDYLNMSAFYHYEQNFSRLHDPYNYKRSQVGMDMNIIF